MTLDVTVADLNIFPLKSFPAHPMKEVAVTTNGALANDRCCRLVRESNGSVVDQKTCLALFGLNCFYRLGYRTMHLSIGVGTDTLTNMDVKDDGKDGAAPLVGFMAPLLGFPFRVEWNWEGGFPDDTKASGPTIISTPTLRRVGEWFGFDLDEARARFRPNIEIDADGMPPFWEDQLFSADGSPLPFRIGEVLVHGINPCARCGVPSRDPVTATEITGFQKRFAELRRAELPPWAPADRFGHYYRLAVNTRIPDSEAKKSIKVGDKLTLVV